MCLTLGIRALNVLETQEKILHLIVPKSRGFMLVQFGG
jgi:hypothetical protein